jgi:hypothetical protein
MELRGLVVLLHHHKHQVHIVVRYT